MAWIAPRNAFGPGLFLCYNRMVGEHGFTTEAAAIADAWGRGDRELAELSVADDMIDSTSVSGTPEQCQARIEAYWQSGIDLPIISPFARGPGAKSHFETAIRACAPAKTR
jgi:alkanesulfonate monooxygenase SsuD/methylene tetrahydromethanopterin reductase-like flavin-dependent oxidoreductase (luciferase family)